MQTSHTLYHANDMLNGISRLKCAVEYIRSSLTLLHVPHDEAHKLLHVDTSLDGILTPRISKRMRLDSPVQASEITILTLTENDTRTNDCQLATFSTSLPSLMNLLCNQLELEVSFLPSIPPQHHKGRWMR